MRFGVSTYSFSSLMKNGSMTQFDAIKKAAQLGFEVIEFSNLFVPDDMTVLEYIENIKEEAIKNGIMIGNYTIGADFINCTGGDWRAEVKRLMKEVDKAVLLGSKGMRHDATRGFPTDKKGAKGFDEALKILTPACREVTQYAHDKGVKTMVENHGYFCQDSERVEKLINCVDHENFGVLLDMGNFLCVDEDPVKAVGRLAGYAFHVHTKDFHYKSGNEPDPGRGWFDTRAGNKLRGSIIGHGIVPVSQCLKQIKKSGYDDVISIEFEGLEDPVLALSIGLENLKSAWESV